MKKHAALFDSPIMSIKQSLRWMIGSRIVLLCATLASTAISSLFRSAIDSARVSFLYMPLSLLLGISAGALFLTLIGWSSRSFVVSQIFLDISIITSIIYITGGPVSPFLFLYLPLILVVALCFGPKLSAATVICSAGAYFSLLAGLMSDWIISADGSAQALLPSNGVFFQALGLISAMVLTAIFSSYLARLSQSSQLIATKSQEALRSLKARQHLLIDSLNEGVITTDSNLVIVGLNASAENLLGIQEQESIGKNFQVLLEDLSESSRTQKLLNTDESRFTLTVTQGKNVLHLFCERHSLSQSEEGALGYLFILQDVTQLRSIEDQLYAHERMARLLAEQQVPYHAKSETSNFPPEFIGETAIMKKVFSLIERVSQSEATVLIGGESGTGKELAAKAIHTLSIRHSRPFIAVNCGAIPENLIESELFGHKKGAFTGATSDHTGLFKQAEGGTLFLDEIGELPLAMQAKLLRVLQERIVRPVGGEKDLAVNVRIIGATNKNLKDEISDGKFREDLFYRLNVIAVKLPPLRERKEDIPLLAHAFLKKISPEIERKLISPAAMQLLLEYPYPGNIRELENIIERALVLGGNIILPEHLPDYFSISGSLKEHSFKNETLIHIDESLCFPVDLDTVLASLERHYIESALSQTKGARKKAAELLNVNMRSFRYRCQKFQIHDDEKNESDK
jgi:two-component system response regulator PilR (NtrC family)